MTEAARASGGSRRGPSCRACQVLMWRVSLLGSWSGGPDACPGGHRARRCQWPGRSSIGYRVDRIQGGPAGGPRRRLHADAVAHGRLPAASLVAGLDEVASALESQPASRCPITLFRPGRLATSLEEVARHSDLHQASEPAVAAGAPDRAQRTKRPESVPIGQMTPLLRLRVELCARQRCDVPEEARTALHELSASAGEGGRLARIPLLADWAPGR